MGTDDTQETTPTLDKIIVRRNFQFRRGKKLVSLLQLQIRGYIDPGLHGCKRALRAVDIHEGQVAVGYEDAILIWDVETMAEVKFIPWENEELVELLFNSQCDKILVRFLSNNVLFLRSIYADKANNY